MKGKELIEAAERAMAILRENGFPNAAIHFCDENCSPCCAPNLEEATSSAEQGQAVALEVKITLGRKIYAFWHEVPADDPTSMASPQTNVVVHDWTDEEAAQHLYEERVAADPW